MKTISLIKKYTHKDMQDIKFIKKATKRWPNLGYVIILGMTSVIRKKIKKLNKTF